ITPPPPESCTLSYTTLFRSPQDEHAAAVTVPQSHQPVVEVALVGDRHAASAPGTPQQRPRRVEDRHPQDDERQEQGCEEEEGLRSEEHTSELQSRENLVCRL